MLFLLTCRGAQIIPDTSPVQQITVPGDRNYGVRMLFLSDLLCPLGVPKSSLTRHLCINSLWVVPYILAHVDLFWRPSPSLTRAGCSKSRFREVLGILLVCSFGVPKSSLTRHLCIKSRWVVPYILVHFSQNLGSKPFLTRAGCSKSPPQKVG